MEGVENSTDLKVFSRNCVKFLTKAFSSSDIIEAFTHCNVNGSWRNLSIVIGFGIRIY